LNPIATDANTLRVGAGFINDKAVTADPVDPVTGRFLTPDADTTSATRPWQGSTTTNCWTSTRSPVTAG
jgi:hypothetical protein